MSIIQAVTVIKRVTEASGKRYSLRTIKQTYEFMLELQQENRTDSNGVRSEWAMEAYALSNAINLLLAQ